MISRLDLSFYLCPLLSCARFRHPISEAHDGNRTRDLFLTKEVLYRLSYVGIASNCPNVDCGAGNGTRTRDPELGRLALYQLSYSRSRRNATHFGGEGRIRTSEGYAGRFTVCSL